MTTTRNRQMPLANQKWDEIRNRLMLAGVMKGETNSAGEFTLNANVASTTVSDIQVHPNTRIIPFPTTANAAAEYASTFIPLSTIIEGSFVVQHANNANADKTFMYLIGG